MVGLVTLDSGVSAPVGSSSRNLEQELTAARTIIIIKNFMLLI
jgi:hypothetical protein